MKVFKAKFDVAKMHDGFLNSVFRVYEETPLTRIATPNLNIEQMIGMTLIGSFLRTSFMKYLARLPKLP